MLYRKIEREGVIEVTKQQDRSLPPKKDSIDKLITIQSDIEKVIKGEKTSTRRMGRFADVGEFLTFDDRKFVIDNVYQQALGEITEEDAKREGYDSLDAYKKYILSLHPEMKWIPNLKVWVHEFSRV